LGNGHQHNEIMKHVQEILSEIKYGSVTLVVQDGKVVQIEKNEKIRIK
jgi:hypothetical protein